MHGFRQSRQAAFKCVHISGVRRPYVKVQLVLPLVQFIEEILCCCADAVSLRWSAWTCEQPFETRIKSIGPYVAVQLTLSPCPTYQGFDWSLHITQGSNLKQHNGTPSVIVVPAR